MQLSRKRLETENLILDAAAFSDWRALYRNLWSQEESARYMLWTVTKSEEEAQERMRRTTAWQKEHPLAWTVFQKTDAADGTDGRAVRNAAGGTIGKVTGEAIGFAGITKIAEGVYEDTGIAVGPAFVRRGYGRQIVTALLEYCFGELGAERFVYSCRSQNSASCALAHACGFRRTHSETRTDPQNGGAYILEFYEQCREDYERCREEKASGHTEGLGEGEADPGKACPADSGNAARTILRSAAAGSAQRL